jgi:hypothetical protein
MNKIEKAFMEDVLTVSTITTGAGIVVKELNEDAGNLQKVRKAQDRGMPHS